MIENQDTISSDAETEAETQPETLTRTAALDEDIDDALEAATDDLREREAPRVPAIRPTDDTLQMSTLAKPAESASIEVRFSSDAWHVVAGKTPNQDLIFNELADAEHRAKELARDLHIGVTVYAADDSIIARYPAD